MKSLRSLRFLSSSFTALTLGSLAAFLPAAPAHAKGEAQVAYSPAIKLIEGDMPVSDSYVLEVTSPASLTGPATVTFELVQMNRPAGLPEADALGFISFGTATLSFSGPLETQSVTVSANVPQGFWTGEYTYQIFTRGWPADIIYIDPGAFLNMTVAPGQGGGGQPPIVDIVTPLNQALYTVEASEFPLTIPFTITASTTDGSPVDSLEADLSGTDLTFATLTGIGTDSVTATGTFQVFDEGNYILNTTAANEFGSTSDTAEVTVRARTHPPTVAITTPGPGLVLEVAAGGTIEQSLVFVGQSVSGTISTLTATLNGNPIDFDADGLGTPTATGTATLTFSASGIYNIVVTATDAHGTATDTQAVTVVIVVPPDPPGLPPVVVIASPLNGAVFTLPTTTSHDCYSAYTIWLAKLLGITLPGTTTTASTVAVPVTFTGTSLVLGGPINQLTATLNGNPFTFTTAGLNTLLATGTTSLNLGPGEYTLVVTARNSFGTATATSKFTVAGGAAATPPTVVINTPADGATYTLSTSGSVTVPLKFTGSSPDTKITKLTAKVNGNTVSFSSSGLNTLTATGNASLCLSSAGTYTIVVTATNSAGTATATHTITVQAPETVIATAITSPPNGATYTLTGNYCSTLSVPFSFVANTTASGGIKTLTAKVNGQSVSFCASGLGSSSAKGSVSLKLSKTGTYTLTVTATDKYKSSTTTHTITVVVPTPPTVTINNPANGASFTVAAGGSLNIPFSFTGTSANSPVTSLSAKINGKSISFSTSGLNTTTATGSATLCLSTPGTYKIEVAAKNAAGTDTETSCFTVVATTPAGNYYDSKYKYWKGTPFTTYSKGGYSSSYGTPGQVLSNNFALAFGSTLEIGIQGYNGYSMKFTSASNVRNFISGGGSSKTLTSDYTNPTSSSITGTYGRQVLTLRINVEFGETVSSMKAAGIPYTFGDLVLYDTCTVFDGRTVAEFLAVAETVLGGGKAPKNVSLSDLNEIADELNNAFDGSPSDWADDHLRPPSSR